MTNAGQAPAPASAAGPSSLEDELRSWLAEHWDPDLTVRAWWRRLAEGRWSAVNWPVEWFGRGLGRADAATVDRVLREAGTVALPGGAGIVMLGPTILDHGDDEQRARLLPPILEGRVNYCQLFSEPGSGSDLPSLATRAERDGDEWVVTGQKVWTSGAESADHGILLARTNPDVAKHAGISYFAFDLDQPGVDIRPLKEMTGRDFFCEVFLDGARVHQRDLIGGEGKGWAAANTTLFHERNLSAGDGPRWSARAGSRGDLDRRAGDLAPPTPTATNTTTAPARQSTSQRLAGLAGANGRSRHPVVRQDLARLHTLEQLNTWTAQRARAAAAAGSELPGSPNIAKMLASHASRLGRALTFDVLGAHGTLHAYSEDGAEQLAATSGIADHADLVEQALFATAAPIYGGSDQIQRNIVGERVLGLAREPDPFKGVPFREVPRSH
ncbi:MAG: acyl-CoA dehydrogenase family protein [Acidimicrobiia bacterium]